MLSRKRMNSIKKELKKIIGAIDCSKFIVKAKDGLFLFDLKNQQRRYEKIDSEIPGYKVEDLKEFSIENIIVCGDGSHETVTIIIDYLPEDIEELNNMVDSYNEDIQPEVLNETLKHLNTETLKKIATVT